MKKVIFILVFLSLFPVIALSTDVATCFSTSSSGYYRLTQDIYADGSYIGTGNSCIDIANHNVVFDLNNYGIYNRNQTTLVGILVRAGVRNFTLQNGLVSDFLNTSTNDIAGILVGGLGNNVDNLRIGNVRVTNSSIGLWVKNITNSNIQIAIDNPTGKFGLIGDWVYNSSFTVFSRSQLYAGIMRNISSSQMTGHFDTDVIITENQTTILGNVLNFITLGLIPASISTTQVQYQSKGIALTLWNSTDTLYKDISATGLVQGIYCGEFSRNNTFGRIDLPFSDKNKGGKFGGVYLTPNCFNNTLCEIKGVLVDDCNQLSFAWACPTKNNVLSESCQNIFAISGIEQKQTLDQMFLTPIFPTIDIPAYPFVKYLTTPLFLSVFIITAISVGVALLTKKAMFGVATFLGLMVIISILIKLYWVGLVLGVIVGYAVFKEWGEKFG